MLINLFYQSYLFVADMLDSGGQLVIKDTFSWNRPNYGQILIERPLYSGDFYQTLL